MPLYLSPARPSSRPMQHDVDNFDRVFPPPHLYVKRCPELWLPGDGKIVVQAGNLGFRVERDILARHSAVFQSIMANEDDGSLAARSAYYGYREGCHYIVVQDAPEDMKELLSAMFIPECVHYLVATRHPT